MIRVALLGASGYVGGELLRILHAHPEMEVRTAFGASGAGKRVGDVHPHLGLAYPDLVHAAWDPALLAGSDLIFAALPHGETQRLADDLLSPGIPIVDLGADFRLDSAADFEAWYGEPHQRPDLLGSFTYGLPEFYRDRIKASKRVAAAGCYPTAANLALKPLIDAGVIETIGIIVDAASGVSGAGRSIKEANLFPEIAEGVAPYAVGHHRHMPEIEQELGMAAGLPVTVSFTPHLVPMNRGELVTMIVEIAAPLAALRTCLAERYVIEPFVHLLPDGVAPATRMVRGSNHAVVNVFADRVPGRAIVVVAIDNLVKGSSGQALQNMNVMLGLPETAGLRQAPLFP